MTTKSYIFKNFVHTIIGEKIPKSQSVEKCLLRTYVPIDKHSIYLDFCLGNIETFPTNCILSKNLTTAILSLSFYICTIDSYYIRSECIYIYSGYLDFNNEVIALDHKS